MTINTWQLYIKKEQIEPKNEINQRRTYKIIKLVIATQGCGSSPHLGFDHERTLHAPLIWGV